MSDSTLADNHSKLREFLASIATIRGDLSNITAPPFVLDTKSAVELPAFWAERPSVFVAAAASNNPAERALLVLRWFLSALRDQQYAGRSAEEGVKKPLNAFLGELFIARWEDESGITRLVSEQVSHHPPVTACRVWNDEHGVSAEGYTRQEITFSGNVNIRQIGHATLQLRKHHESYLIPLPNVKIKGILTGGPYPELEGTYYIPSTNGYMSEIVFDSKGFFGSSSHKHRFEAKVYRQGDEEHPLYTISGNWDHVFVIHDVANNADIETFDVTTAKTTPIKTDPISEQDAWESRVAWRGVREALESGNMQGVADAKSKLENGQREMRKGDGDGKDWRRLFYDACPEDPIAQSLGHQIGQVLDPRDTVAAWKFRSDAWDQGVFEKPYRGTLRPNNSHASESPGEPRVDLGAEDAVPLSGEVSGTGVEPQAVISNGPGEDAGNDKSNSKPASLSGSGTADMGEKERRQVEDFLRYRHSSKKR